MKETLFRAKVWYYDYDRDEVLLKWVMGQPNLVALTNEGPTYDFVTHTHGKLVMLGVGDTYIYNPERFTYDPDTLGQFTGMKDKNDKKIFEGDIIRFHGGYCEGYWVGEVKYEESWACYVAVGTRDVRMSSLDPGTFKVELCDISKSTIEIIGNRWDNADILEE